MGAGSACWVGHTTTFPSRRGKTYFSLPMAIALRAGDCDSSDAGAGFAALDSGPNFAQL